MKFTLHLKPVNGGPFNCAPARDVDINDSDVLANDVVFEGEFNPNNVRFWVIGNEFGVLCALWAPEHKLLETAVDEGKLDGHMIEQDDLKDYQVDDFDANNPEYNDVAFLGNAEPFDLTNVWYQQVDITPSDKTFSLLLRFAEARGSASDTLFF